MNLAFEKSYACHDFGEPVTRTTKQSNLFKRILRRLRDSGFYVWFMLSLQTLQQWGGGGRKRVMIYELRGQRCLYLSQRYNLSSSLLRERMIFFAAKSLKDDNVISSYFSIRKKSATADEVWQPRVKCRSRHKVQRFARYRAVEICMEKRREVSAARARR